MHWLDRLSAKKGQVGIELQPRGCALVARGCFGDSQKIDAFYFAAHEEGEDERREALAQLVQKAKVQRRVCHVSLSPKDYQLLLVEAPDVPASDMREALRWRIKDLISMPVDNAVVEVLAIPQNGERAGKKMVYAVVTKRDRIEAIRDLIEAVDLRLASVDISEMALRNATLLAGEDLQDRGVGVVRIWAGGGVVSLYQRGNLYLSRQFQLKYDGGLLEELPEDTLALEVQRSLDYYERQMGLAPPASLLLYGDAITADKITQNLTRAINVPLKFFDIGDLITAPGANHDIDLQYCLAALGNAHREAVAA